jgi:cyclophilin family peptidyl-prolyl cis-trans isomerase
MKKLLCVICLLGFTASVHAYNEGDMVLLDTNYGDIVIDLDYDAAPITVENFEAYVNDEFYNNLTFHRVIDGFMIQGGGFYADLSKREPTRDPIINEFGRSNLRGTVAMAKTPGFPNSATSQFFINLGDNSGPPPALDTQNGGFTVFGEVVSGMDVVDAIAGVDTHDVSYDMKDVPDDPVIIENATVIPEPATIVLLGLGCLAFVRKRKR